MTPDKLSKSGSEHGHQVALFAFLAVARNHGFKVAWEWADTGELKKNEEQDPFVHALEWIHAIPNGGSRGDDAKSRSIRGGQMKAEGVRQGVADIFLPWPIFETYYTEEAEGVERVKWCGLYVEMKKPSMKPKNENSKGGLSNEQSVFGTYCNRNSYGWVLCYSWREAAEVIQRYIEWNK